MGIEYELKFRAEESVLSQVQQDFPGTYTTLKMQTVYYDTPSGALSGRYFTLRRRLENGRPICTLKAPAPGGARGEWETPCDDIFQAIPALCKLGAPKELPALVSEGLLPVCGAEFTRRCLTLSFQESVLELALDTGFLFGGDAKVPLCEVEVELKSGDVSAANAFSALLQRKYGLQREDRSKFSRARDLYLGE